MFNIVLLEPRIPQNVGNIGRLCVAGWARLHLIYPLGFILSQKEIKRSGMDYWEKLQCLEWDSLQDFHQAHPIDTTHFFLSTKANQDYYEANFCDECFIYFGREDAGLPPTLWQEYPNQTYKLPMREGRSINLATCAGAVLYEAIRQNRSILHTQHSDFL